jgi:hypothetical protein
MDGRDEARGQDHRGAVPPPAPLPSMPNVAEVESASSAFARVEHAASASTAAAVAPTQPSAAPIRGARERDLREAREQEARDARDARAKVAAQEKPGRRLAAAPAPAHHPQQPLAAEDFEDSDLEPRIAVTPAAGNNDAGPRAKQSAADSASKQSVLTVAVEAPVEIAKASEAEIPVGLVELPTRGKVVVTPEPAKGITPTVSGSPDHAQVHLGSIVTQSAVSKASVRGALNESALRRCYQDALRLGAAGGVPMTAQLELATAMNGRVSTANVTGGLPKQLANCVEQVAKSGRVREVDTGVAKATVTLEFQP